MKYASKQIYQMTETEVLKIAQTLLLKIHIITGWVIPSSELMVLLVDQFYKKLSEDYGMLNPDEIEYAFRSTGTTVIDWGKDMNLNLIDQVLLPYVEKRSEISFYEEKMKSNPVQRIYTDEEILNERRGMIETAYQAMRKGYLPLIFDFFGEILVKDKFIEDEKNVSEFFVHCLGNNIEKLYEETFE